MAYNNFAETLVAQDGNFFKRIMQSIRDLLTGFRRGGMVSHEKAAQNLLDRLDKIAEKEFRRLEKVVERKTEEKAAESSVSNETTEADTDKGENENEGDTQENDDSRYSVSETLDSDLDSILDGTFDAARNELYLGETSNFLTDVIGANGLSLYMPASKAYSSLVTRAEYEKKPYYSEQDNYHGIGKQDFIEILEKSENPIAAFAAPSDEKGNKRQNRIVLVTDKVIRDVESGKEGYAVVIEEVDTYGVAEGKRVRANKAITIYPRTKMNADLALAVSEGRLLDITQKGEHLFAGVRGSNPQAAIRKDVLKKNIAHFWENVKWQSEKNKISSSEGKATPSAMQEALQKAGYDIQYTQDFENDSSRRPASDDTSSGADAKETAKEGIGRRYSVSPEFEAEYDAWDKVSAGGYFKLGSTSKALESIGINPSDIYWDKSKIIKIQKEHPEMTDEVIKQIPYLLEHPVVVMQSQTVVNRVVVFGEVYANGKPVLCALELKPNGLIDNFIKVASAYTKNGVQQLLNSSDILYLDPDKKRTDSWFQALRLQLPAGVTNYGSIGSVTYSDRNVKGEIVFGEKNEAKSAIQEALERAGYTADQEQYMQTAENDTARYSVAGTHSLDADFGEFDRALQMYQNGDSKNDIVRETGWWLGKDGKWRYEISDEEMDFEPNGFVKNPKTVGDYVKHDKLFSAYPELKDIKVTFVDKVGDSNSAKGTYQKNAKTIQIKKNVVEAEAKEIVLHELQHAIQHMEGFKRGSSKKTGGMLAFNEIYRHVKRYPRFQDLKSKSAKFNYVKAMADIEGGSSFDLLARGAYLNDHGEFEARKTVERMNMSQEQLRNEPYFNDGIVLDNDLTKQTFIDNLLEIGYNRKQASQIAEKGFFNDYQRKDGYKLDDARNAGHEGQGAGRGRENVSENYDLQDGRQRQVHGAGEVSVSDTSTEKNGNRSGRGRVNQEPSGRFSASGEIDMDDGAVGYEELKRQVAAQKEQIYRLTKEMVLSHGGTLDAKEVNRFLKETLARYGATLSVKDVERDFQEIVGYLYRNEIVHRDAKGNFLSVEKGKACFFPHITCFLYFGANTT